MKTNFYQRRINFPNGYTASVVSHGYSYGGEQKLFEIAVMRDGEIVYDTPVTDDVIGYLDFDEVARALEEIKALPVFGTSTQRAGEPERQ